MRQDMLIARGLLAPFAEDGSVDPRVEEMGLARPGEIIFKLSPLPGGAARTPNPR